MVDNFFTTAKQNGITIFCRSAFLQGLILNEEDEIPEYLIDAKQYIIIFNELVQKYEVDAKDVLLHFVCDNKYIDYLVLGVDTKEQLINNLESVKKKTIPKKLISEIQVKFKHIDKNIIIPSLWKKI